MTTTTITATRMRQLLDHGHARPLLEGHFPVPVELGDQWWHVPACHGDVGGVQLGDVVFVPAPPELGARFDRLVARRRAADAAVQRAGRGGAP